MDHVPPTSNNISLYCIWFFSQKGYRARNLPFTPIHRGATNVEDEYYEWFPLVDSPDPVRTQGPVQIYGNV